MSWTSAELTGPITVKLAKTGWSSGITIGVVSNSITSYTWQIPCDASTYADGPGYYFVLESSGVMKSSGTFSISGWSGGSAPTLTVSLPANSAVWKRDQLETISWNPSNNLAGMAAIIEVTDLAQFTWTQVASAVNILRKSLNYTVPTSFIDSVNYRVRVSIIGCPSYQVESTPFSVRGSVPSLTPSSLGFSSVSRPSYLMVSWTTAQLTSIASHTSSTLISEEIQGVSDLAEQILMSGQIPWIIVGCVVLMFIGMCCIVWRLFIVNHRLKKESQKSNDGYLVLDDSLIDKSLNSLIDDKSLKKSLISLPPKLEFNIDRDFMQGERLKTKSDTYVYKCILRNHQLIQRGMDDMAAVVKVVAKDEFTMRHDHRIKFLTEVSILFKLRNGKNIAKIVGFCRAPAAIIMKRYEFDLECWIYSRGNYPNDFKYSHQNLIFVMAQIAEGIAFVHRKGLVHGDLQPSNILLDKNGIDYFPVITDFSCAYQADSKMTRVGVINNESIAYTAPEVLMSFSPDFENTGPLTRIAKAGDIFSFAMICLELLQKQLWYVPMQSDVAILPDDLEKIVDEMFDF